MARLSQLAAPAVLCALVLTGGCNEFTASASESEALLYTPVSGDTVHVTVASTEGPVSERGEPRLVWGTTLPLDSKPHRMEVQTSSDPTFENASFGSTRYEHTQRTYSERIPRPREVDYAADPTGPLRVYWRVRVAGGRSEVGPWSEPGAFVVVVDRP